MPRGWYGQPRRHSIAAKLGWSRRRSKLPKYDREKLRRIHANRRRVSRLRDERTTAKKVVPEDKITDDEYISQVHSWTKDPGHSDIEDIDTKKKKSNAKELTTQEIKMIKHDHFEMLHDDPSSIGKIKLKQRHPDDSPRKVLGKERFEKVKHLYEFDEWEGWYIPEKNLDAVIQELHKERYKFKRKKEVKGYYDQSPYLHEDY